MMMKDYRRLIEQSHINMIQVLQECPRQNFFFFFTDLHSTKTKSKLNKHANDEWRSDRGINIIYIIRYT